MNDDTSTDRPPQQPDGGTPQQEFKQIDWQQIDAEKQERSLKSTIWGVIVALWGFLFVFTLFVRYVIASDRFNDIPGVSLLDTSMVAAIPFLSVDGGWLSFPIVGVIALHDWMWSMTLLGFSYYAVVPMIERPRMTRYYWRRFKKNKAAVISALFLVVMFLVGVVGSRITPTAEENAGMDSIPPVWSSVEYYVPGPSARQELDGCTMNEGVCQGTWEYPFGTTVAGEDLFLAILDGMEISLMVGLTATAISTVIAATVALVAVYYGGWVDEGLMRYVDIQLTFPAFFLYLLIVYTIQPSLFVLILVFGFIEWGGGARLMRSEALQRREEPYITASKAAGANPLWTMRRHLLPNISNTIITYMSLSIPAIILSEAALSFLGLGDPTVYSWGQLITEGRDRLSSAWWQSTLPGIFLFLMVLAFNFVGDALRDAIDPRHGGSE